MHHHIIKVGCPWLDEFIPDNLNAFGNLIEKNNVLLILNGHAHFTTKIKRYGTSILGLGLTAYQFEETVRSNLFLRKLQYRIISIRKSKLRSEVIDVPIYVLVK